MCGGGIEDAFIETKVLGKKMAEQFLHRTHYAGSLRAISVSTNAINRQKLEAFWERYDINEYKDLLPLLQAIYENTTVRPAKPCNKTFNLFKEKLTKLQNDFLKFCKDRGRKSAICRCLNNILYMVLLFKNLVDI